MPKKRFSDGQIAFALRQAEAGTTVGEICRKMGICSPSALIGQIGLIV
jgi:putative transposase